MMQQLTRFALFCAVPTTLAAVALPTTAGAAVIVVADHNRLQDGEGDGDPPVNGIGDYATQTSDWAVGKHGNGTRYRYGYAFDLTDDLATISTAESIVFSLERITNTNSAISEPDMTISLVALSRDESGELIPSDYEGAGVVVTTVEAPEPGEFLSVDVTDLVQADALAGNYTSFRLQLSSDLVDDPNSSTDHFGFYFNNAAATLVTSTAPIPEPASLALLGLGGLVALRRRSR